VGISCFRSVSDMMDLLHISVRGDQLRRRYWTRACPRWRRERSFLEGRVSAALAGLGFRIDATDDTDVGGGDNERAAAVMPPSNVTEAWRNTVRRVVGAFVVSSPTAAALRLVSDKWMMDGLE